MYSIQKRNTTSHVQYLKGKNSTFFHINGNNITLFVFDIILTILSRPNYKHYLRNQYNGLIVQLVKCSEKRDKLIITQ